MKKIVVCFMIIVLCFFASSCSDNRNINVENSDNMISQNNNSINDLTQNLFETVDSKSTTLSEDSVEKGGAELLPRKYRNNYYSIPASFIKIVGKESFEKWEDIYLAENYPDDSNEMVMLAYVKEFEISKEDFERANLEYAKFIDAVYSHICLNPQDYADQEMQEIYNTEIIYSFDNKKINEYYLGIDYPFLNEYQYDEAIANGTYKTRTTEFINIEQMEAEIIEKYGEAEIVIETTPAEEASTAAEDTAIPEETTA